MHSMTGYGNGTAERDGIKLTVEIKSVNHRFLDMNIKSPRILNAFEDNIRRTIKSRILRGHTDVYINYSALTGENYSVKVNYELAYNYVNIARELASRYSITDDMTATRLIGVKDVLGYEEQSPDESIIYGMTDEALLAALEKLTEMRRNEGARIKQDLVLKIDEIAAVVSEIKQYAPRQLEEYSAELRKRVKSALGEIPLDENKLMNEIVFYADKVAVDEEFTRLFAHIEHFRAIAEEEGAVGRQLDFIVQEMNREANTIGSKCNNSSLTQKVVELKTLIEKVREQVQNVE